jgi:hypothetical protein
MNQKRLTYLALLCVILLLSNAQAAFHDGSVAQCNACHIIHNMESGQPIDPAHPGGNVMLLKYESATMVCLSCHATDFGAVWGNNALQPPSEKGAGNFVFLTEDNLNDAPDGALHPKSGDYAGHNCIAPAMGVYRDPNYSVAPGGTYPSNELGCTSCHNPHGNTNYCMLWGAEHVTAGDYTFSNPAPTGLAVALSTPENPTNHSAYRGGWSAWCGNCHGAFHEGGQGFYHPTDHILGSDIANRYNSYAGQQNPSGGSSATAYLPQVPFEDLNATRTSTEGPSSSSRIACLTCHRAHATSAPESGRWDFYIAALGQDGVISHSFPISNPYSDPQQRQLCVKCHSYGDSHGQGQACIECHREPLTIRHIPKPIKPQQ